MKTHLCYVVCCIFLVLRENLADDPCVDYTELDDPDRSAAFVTEGTGKCDSAITEGWYRSVSGAGSDFPTSEVPTGRCGTQFPIWMDDIPPVNNAEKDVKLCISHFTGACISTITIKAKNCGDFNVYKLTQTSGCPMRYCFGTNLKCPDGQSSATGFSPGCEGIPDTTLSMTVTPFLTDGVTTTPNMYYKVVKFECKLDSEPDNNDDLRFEVKWFINDTQVSSVDNKQYSELNDTHLSEEDWIDTYKLGFDMKCTMRVRYKDKTVYGALFESGVFYAGFKVDSSAITVKEKETKEIKIWLTVPVGCFRPINNNGVPCNINIRVWNPKYQIDMLESPSEECSANGFETGSVVFDAKDCGVHFEHESWDAVKTLKITGQSDNSYNIESSRLTHIRLKAETSIFPPRTWSDASIPDIKVYVLDSDGVTMQKVCYSNNDPHMGTFDGKPYEHHTAGTYTMMQIIRAAIMIQATFAMCYGGHGGPTCNCGLAIRHLEAVFIINFCGDLTHPGGGPTNNFIARIACEDKYMRITQNGNTYTIQLPTGTTVIVHTYGNSGISSIHIKPSVDDQEQSSGLCGDFDGDPNNDFTLRDGTRTTDSKTFAEDWRVKGTDINLFDGNLHLQSSPQQLQEYCKCKDPATGQALVESSNILCNLHSAMIPCKETPVDDSGFFKICWKSRTRRDVYSHHINKRETEEEDDDVFDIIPLTYPSDYENFTEPIFTWGNGWNEELARQKCTEYLKSSKLVTACDSLIPNFGKSINKTVEECVLDIKITGNTSYMETSLSALSSGCIMEAKKFENLTTSNSTSGNSSKTLLDDILDESCEKNCSGNGLCVKGICECLDGFYGNLCNLLRSTAPSISKNSNTGLCKTDQKSCRSYGIVGANMIRGSLKCRARHFKLYGDNSTEVNDTVLEFNGTYVNEFSCVCTVPDSRRRRAANPATVIADGYHISVSNDGINFSDEITFINYDSTCYECNTTATTCSALDSCPTTTTSMSTTDMTGTATTTTASTASTTGASMTTITAEATATTTTSAATAATSTATTTTSTATAATEATATEQTATTPLTQTTPAGGKKTAEPTKENNLGMIIAIAIGVVAMVALAVAVGVCIMKKKTAPKRRINLSEADLRIGYGNDYKAPPNVAPTDTKYRMRPPSAQSSKSIELDFDMKY